MDINFYTKPWHHCTIDNFFPDEIYKRISSHYEDIARISDTYFYPDTQTKYYFSTHKPLRVDDIDLDADLDEVKKSFEDVLGDLPDLIQEFMDDNFALFQGIHAKLGYREMFDRMFLHGIQMQPPEYWYHIHDEAEKKYMSLVAYMAPEENFGTMLYESEETPYDEPYKHVEWKPNRAFIFSGNKRTTYHAFKTNEYDHRQTYVAFFGK